MLIKLRKLLILTILQTGVIRAAKVVNETEKYTNYALSIIGLGELLRIESELIGQLEQYEEKLTEKLELMRLVVDDLRAEHQKSANDPVLYLSNPLNGFALIRRTYDDWVKWHDLVRKLEAKPQIDLMEELKVKMPTQKDVKEATVGIVRIQDTYEMSADEVANGFLNGKQYDARLSALDCYVIGKYLENELKYDASINWFNVSAKLFNEYDGIMSDVLDFHEANILHVISECLLEIDLYYQARDLAQRAYELKPDDAKIFEYQNVLRWYIAHDELCRGEIHHKPRLQCHYNYTTTPFLKLAPLKFEEIAHDPYIVLYHDIVYDHEIEEIKNMSMPQMTRAQVGKGFVDPIRTAQMAKLRVNESEVMARIQRRLDDMSGLDWTEAHPLQVLNYGIGGHYIGHTDYFDLTLNPGLASSNGDRIVSILIYLSDVEEGGGTAFPQIDTVVQPRKGSAILWYHLDNAGNGNPKSMHAACPVLLGSKWVAIKLTFHWPQMFIKPCHK